MRCYHLGFIDNGDNTRHELLSGGTLSPLVREPNCLMRGEDIRVGVVLVADSTLDNRLLYIKENVLAPNNDRIEFDATCETLPLQEHLAVITHQTPKLDLLKSHFADLGPYVGQWVVLHNDEIIAHGRDLTEATAIARSQGIQKPLVFKVPNEDPEIEIIGL